MNKRQIAILVLGVAMIAPIMAAPVMRGQAETWRLVLEHEDGSSEIADTGLTLEDCDREFRQLDSTLTRSIPIIYCEREG